MKRSSAAIVWQLIIEEGWGIDPSVDQSVDWVVWRNYTPDDEDTEFNIIVSYDTIGRRTGRVQRDGDSIIYPGVQLQTRGGSATEAFQKMSEIAEGIDALTVPRVVTVDGFDFDLFNLSRRDIFSLGKEVDSKRRFTYAMTLFATVRERVTP